MEVNKAWATNKEEGHYRLLTVEANEALSRAKVGREQRAGGCSWGKA